jgi:hypothetical protein
VRRSAVGWIPVFLLLIVLGIIYGRHLTGYFFLFDDFALLRESADHHLGAILREPLFGFFRPLPFALTRLQFAMFGWNAPWIYSATGLAVHAANAALVWLIARRLRLERAAAAAAALTFLLSASAAETYFWLSGIFDRLAACGILVSILAGLACLDMDRRRALAVAGLGLAAAAAALLSKETAIVLPVLIVATMLMRTEPLPRGRAALLAGGITLIAALFLGYRSRVLPGFTGAYGDWTSLVSRGEVLAHAGTYLRAIIVLPLPYEDAPAVLRAVVAGAPYVLTAAWLFVVGRLARARPRFLACGLLAAGATVLPVIWTPAVPGSSASGRFLYLGGIWLSLLMGAAVQLDRRSSDRPRPAVARLMIAAVSLAVGYQAASVIHQARLWRAASVLSREAVQQMGRYRDVRRDIFILNMPSSFIEGPYVLKDYAFEAYFGASFKPVVRARRMAVTFVHGAAWFGGWLDDAAPAASDRMVVLNLPVHVPSPAPRVMILSPAGAGPVRPPFTLRGWAADPEAAIGCGVDFVHIYVRLSDRPPVFLGAAASGEPSLEAVSVLGPRFARCGWSLVVRGLQPAAYIVSAHPHDTAVMAFAQPAALTVNVIGPQE